MRTVMGNNREDLSSSSFSFSRHPLKWVLRSKPSSPDHQQPPTPTTKKTKPTTITTTKKKQQQQQQQQQQHTMQRLRVALLSALRRPTSSPSTTTIGSRLLGTLFGNRRGHVHLSFQVDPKLPPVLLLELATPTGSLVREMASGLVRVALECEKKKEQHHHNQKPRRKATAAAATTPLLQEPMWRTYCNGRKWGYAVRRECGDRERGVLRAVEPITMGAGVLPVSVTGVSPPSDEGEMMYMRARFERVVGSRDSEAFYMISPDSGSTHASSSGGPELSIYLLRF